MPEFIDQVGGVGGTPLNAAALDAEVVASSYIVTGGIPVTYNNFTITQPATAVVINAGAGSAVYVPAGGSVVAACQLTASASSDTYVDILPTGLAAPAVGTAAYTVTAVANNASAPTLATGSMRLYKAISNGSAVTSIVALASTYPITPSMMATNVANGLVQINSSGYIPMPLLQPGASGVATLDTNGRLAQAIAHGLRQIQVFTQSAADVTFNNNNASSSTAVANWNAPNSGLYTVTLTGLSSSTVLVGVSASASSSNSVANVLRLASFRTGDSNVQLMANNSVMNQNQWYNFAGFTLYTGLTGSQTFTLYSQGGGATPNITAKVNSQPGTDALLFFAAELG